MWPRIGAVGAGQAVIEGAVPLDDRKPLGWERRGAESLAAFSSEQAEHRRHLVEFWEPSLTMISLPEPDP